MEEADLEEEEGMGEEEEDMVPEVTRGAMVRVGEVSSTPLPRLASRRTG
jgi:hypothetical protein